MEAGSNKYCTRKVGHVVINWKIHDYVLTRPSCNIISPEFQVRGPQTTKWRLILHPYSYTNQRDTIVQLQRLDKEPVVVFAIWRAIMKDNQGNSFYINGSQAFLKQYSVHGCTFSGAVNIILDRFKAFSDDKLCLQIQLLVTDKEANNSFKRCSDIGLKSLSRDLLALYKCGKNSDVEMRINDKPIRAHKAILKARSPYFKSSFEKNSESDVFYLSSLDYRAVDKVLSYLYSGKLEFVLGKPSIAIYDCAQRFQIKEIKQYYAFDDLFWESRTDVEEIMYVWRIRNFDISSDRYIQSQCLNSVNSNITLYLSLYPRGEDGNSDFLSLFVEILELKSQQRVCVDSGIMNHYGKVWTMSRELWIDENSPQVAFRQFANKAILNNPEIFQGILIVGIRLRISGTEATWKTAGTSCLNAFVSPNETEHSYRHLSNQIVFLFTNGLYKDSGLHQDITLATGCLNFRVHNCILAARSHGFSKMIRKMIHSQVTNSSLDMKSEIFVAVMAYLYSGILKDYKPSDVTEIYNVAEEFTIPILKIICSQILGSTLTVQNVSDVLIFSQSKQDRELKLSALEFVCLNQSAVDKQQNWQKLSQSHPLLYNEAQEFAKNKCNIDRPSANLSVPINR